MHHLHTRYKKNESERLYYTRFVIRKVRKIIK